MAHWDLFRPHDLAYEVELVAELCDGRAAAPEAVQVPERFVLEVLRLAQQHRLPLLSRLPAGRGEAERYLEREFQGVEDEWAALREYLTDARAEEALDPVFALVAHACAQPAGWLLWVRAP